MALDNEKKKKNRQMNEHEQRGFDLVMTGESDGGVDADELAAKVHVEAAQMRVEEGAQRHHASLLKLLLHLSVRPVTRHAVLALSRHPRQQNPKTTHQKNPYLHVQQQLVRHFVV